MATIEKIREAQAGTEVNWWGDKVKAAPKCEELDSGQWYCSTHQEGFRGNWMVNSHAEDGKAHLLVWVCAAHGPEQP